jgi:CubicO group peptidase (beta-lactamase class C family)
MAVWVPPMTDLTFTTTVAELEQGREDGLHLGGQLAVSLKGVRVADLAFGEAQPGEAMRPDHLMHWFSSGKPVTAIAIARLWESGALGLDDTVATHIPEFAARGKEAITIRHLLTHAGGIRVLDLGWPKLSWDEIIERICGLRLEPRWVPGAKAGYHLTSSWFILGEIIQRLTGQAISTHLRQVLFEPLGMTRCWVGMELEQAPGVLADVAPMWNTVEDIPERYPWSTARHLSIPSPGSSAVGPMRELVRLYETLLAGGSHDNFRLLSPQTVEAMTARQRVGLYDHTFRHRMDWGLGFVLDSRHYNEPTAPYGYGHHASTRVFGHGGYRSSTGFADPEHDLAVALAVNGTPSDEQHRLRFDRLVTAIYEDLGLATGEATGEATAPIA